MQLSCWQCNLRGGQYWGVDMVVDVHSRITRFDTCEV